MIAQLSDYQNRLISQELTYSPTLNVNSHILHPMLAVKENFWTLLTTANELYFLHDSAVGTEKLWEEQRVRQSDTINWIKPVFKLTIKA